MLKAKNEVNYHINKLILLSIWVNYCLFSFVILLSSLTPSKLHWCNFSYLYSLRNLINNWNSIPFSHPPPIFSTNYHHHRNFSLFFSLFFFSSLFIVFKFLWGTKKMERRMTNKKINFSLPFLMKWILLE